MKLLEIQKLNASYKKGGKRYPVLHEISFSVDCGEFVAIEGPSGSGKSTLFYLLGCLLKPDSGKIFFEGQDLTALSRDELAFIRNQKIGFVFQQFHLLPKTSVLNNILLPTFYPCEGPWLNEKAQEKQKEKAQRLAQLLGIEDKLNHYPNQLSGGQQQRVAIARALMNDVKLILADEPTGNLDSKSALQIMALLKELNAQGKTIILITHDPKIADHCHRKLKFKDGFLTESHPLRDQVFTSPSPSPSGVALETETNFSFGRSGNGLDLLNAYFRLCQRVSPLVIKNLLMHKVRALLTMLGVTVGIASVLAMITFGEFVKGRILQGYQDLGVNTLAVWGQRNWRMKATDKAHTLFDFFDIEKDINKLYDVFPNVIRTSPMLSGGLSSVSSGGISIEDDVWVAGIGSDFLALANRKRDKGRSLSPYHIQRADGVCMIGAEIVERLFAHRDPIGKVIFISQSNRVNYPCRVIGTLQPLSTTKDWMKPNRQVLVPWTYYQATHQRWETQIHRFYVQLKEGSDVSKNSSGIKSYFQQKYGPSGFFSMGTDAILIAQMRTFLNLFTLMLGMIALITLGVGGMGINNMMLVAISERLKEIGLRKALGATDRSIRVQFLLESVYLCALSGVVGLVLGFSCYELMIYLTGKLMSHIPFAWFVDPLAIFLSLGCIIVVGLVSGLAPALKAEKLQVIEALRSD